MTKKRLAIAALLLLAPALVWAIPTDNMTRYGTNRPTDRQRSAIDLYYGYNNTTPDTMKAYAIAKELSDASDPVGCYLMAKVYGNGFPVSKDLESAAAWYRKAAKKGNALAQNNLGYMYLVGFGVERDIAEGVRLTRKAADQGFYLAQFMLGRCYSDGAGVDKDMTQAVTWYRKAADAGLASAQKSLADCYLNGDGVERDLNKALALYRKAADQGDVGGQINLVQCYANGWGTEKNREESLRWLRKAADQGHARSQDDLGVRYFSGDGVEKDYKEANRWFRKAADQGFANAQKNLAASYYKGTGVPKDLRESIKWYRLAGKEKIANDVALELEKGADQGPANTQKNLAASGRKGTGVPNLREAIKQHQLAGKEKIANDAALELEREGVSSAQPLTETVVQTGHAQYIHGFCISSDNKYLVSWSNDKSIILWDMATNRQIRTFSGHKSMLTHVEISSDNRHIASRDYKDTLNIWDAMSGKIERQLKTSAFKVTLDRTKLYYLTPNGDWACLSFKDLDKPSAGKSSPSGTRRMSLSPCKAEQNVSDLGPLRETTYTHGRNDLVSPDKKYGIKGKEGNYRVYDLKAGQSLFKLSGHENGVYTMAIHPTRTLVCGTDLKKIYVWNYATGKLVRKIDKPSSFVAFSRDGKYLVHATSDITFVNLENWGVSKEFKGYSRSPVCLTFNPSGTMLATGHADGIARLWDLNRVKMIRRFKLTEGVSCLVFAPDGKTLVAGGEDRKLRMFDIGTGMERFSLSFPGSVDRICMSLDGKTIACAGGRYEGGAIVIPEIVSFWKVSKEEKEKAEQKILNRYAISVIDIASEPRILHTFKGHRYAVNDLRFSPDGNTLVSGGGDCVILWDVKTGTIQRKHEGGIGLRAKSIEIDSTGKMYTVGYGDGKIVVWNWQNGAIITAWQAYDDPKANVDRLLHKAGELISSSSEDGNIKFWDFPSGRLRRTLTKPHDVFHDAAASSNGKWLATVSYQGQISLWDLEENQEKLILAGIGDDDFVATTSEGYYTGSPQASRGVHVVKGLNVFTYESFDIISNRPDKILKILGVADESLVDAYYRAWQKRVRKLGFKETQLSRELHLPELKIRKGIPFETANPDLSFSIKARDSKYLLDRINVYVNDVPVYGMKGESLKSLNTKELTKKVRVKLSSGSNFVAVSVHNEKGIESLKQGFQIVNRTSPKKRELYVVCLGVSDYLNYTSEDGDLDFAAKDATELAGFLTKQQTAFTNARPIVLTDSLVSRASVNRIKQTLMKSRVDDGVVLFFAGHGLLDNNLDYYLATYDIDMNDPAQKGIPYGDFESLFDGIPARKKLVLMDACHSGEVDKEESVTLASASPGDNPNIRTRGLRAVRKGKIGLYNSFELMKELFADISKGTGAIVISSASGLEVAFESDKWKNGAFTYSLLQGLGSSGTDSNADGTISVGEIRDYVVVNVEKLTGGKQHPTTRKGNLEFDFGLVNIQKRGL